MSTLSAGVIVIRRDGGMWLFLLLRVFTYWDFPKGIVEQGEQPLAAACREVCEETTINDLVFHWGYGFRETLPYGPGKIARYYVAETKTEKICLPVNPELGHPEHHEFRWLRYADAKLLVASRVQPILEWANTLIR